MRMKKVKNTSARDVQVELEGGVSMSLPPGAEVKNIRVQNLGEIRDKVEAVSDLGEICEVRTNKTKLLD